MAPAVGEVSEVCQEGVPSHGGISALPPLPLPSPTQNHPSQPAQLPLLEGGFQEILAPELLQRGTCRAGGESVAGSDGRGTEKAGRLRTSAGDRTQSAAGEDRTKDNMLHLVTALEKWNYFRIRLESAAVFD